MLHIIGLGPGGLNQMTGETYALLTGGLPVYLRTAEHPAAQELRERGIAFQSGDAFYENAESFEVVYAGIVEAVMTQVATGDLVYGVPGNPMCAESTVTALIAACEKQAVAYRLYPAVSFIDAVMTAVRMDPVEGLQIIDAFQLAAQPPKPGITNLITQVYSPMMACEVKLKLATVYDDETMVYLVMNAGMPDREDVRTLPLYQIDTVTEINPLTSLVIPPQPDNLRDFDRLVAIMSALRGPGGCAWDRAQTHESLRKYLLEETREALDAIAEGDLDHLCEELGDVLFQVMFHAQIEKEAGMFDILDIIEGLNAKMIRRHPHVFGSVTADTPEAVSLNWEAIKKQEKQGQSVDVHPMDAIPKTFSALMRGDKIMEKAIKAGFKWPSAAAALDKVTEETAEIREALAENNPAHLAEEIGDLFIAAVCVAQMCGVSSEAVLHQACQKYIRRYKKTESILERSGKPMADCTITELVAAWKQAKNQTETV